MQTAHTLFLLESYGLITRITMEQWRRVMLCTLALALPLIRPEEMEALFKLHNTQRKHWPASLSTVIKPVQEGQIQHNNFL